MRVSVISSQPSFARSAALPEEPTEDCSLTGPRELSLGGALLGCVSYKAQKTMAKLSRWWSGETKSLPKVKIERPLVAVQGFASRKGAVEPLLEHLTREGSNGGQVYYVQNGKFYSDVDCRWPVPESERDEAVRIFRVVPLDREMSPAARAERLGVELEAVREFKNCRLLDVVAHSMGGLVVRHYLDRADDHLGKVLMAGTPHRGSRNATDAYKALAQGLTWALAVANVGPGAAAALEFMRSMEEYPEANPALNDLNSRFESQMARTQDYLTVGSTTISTPSFREGGREPGDGLVEGSSFRAVPQDSHVEVFTEGDTLNHHTVLVDRAVFARMTEFFAWDSV